MAIQGNILELDRCVHCSVDKPSLPAISSILTSLAHDQKNEHTWRVYGCTRCGGAILTGSPKGNRNIYEMYPEQINIDKEIPDRAKEYLEQALNSISSPAGAVMLAASSIDSMLKAKGLKTGSLYGRIKNAVDTNLITDEMATWAHDVRLDANDQRHADDDAPLPSYEDAKRVIEFAQALATFLFVLPARVQRGINEAKES
ncbi:MULTISPECIES: DUF4145 domain-containing protein [unclassified Colwellia]|uniref:DUF4145 domain-containing protein n=1 Tax=unclassified Colwellia TaxID=196834 RepID=UPI0015F5EA32|nr:MULTISPECIES: DUF4145 domain-containing protein [unclassified Colwellia]MBA6381360.1 DUF4145 domain-containing protein [Colwellia sp. BRX10-7]MBA6389108.1 DUF4145 domain-containing protein [Colwellia sp. BRX10-2]MBA6403827.1 DUF4145 domain-containing protein [Colwellia sp. BRX10-5]MBA6407705.1 DUF4145 domain-containing protein [Colwellia sp. BRX10-1]